ncbi:MAG: hypothetical protein ACJ8HU_02715 [Chthoniobacterales bacterium]
MKPMPQTETTNCRESVTARSGARFPMTDCQYMAGRLGNHFGGGEGKRHPSIRGISEEYFENEARNHFASEAAIFALIAVTSAVPVIEGVRGLVHFVCGVL